MAAKLRPSNVHSAEDWEEVPLPEIDFQQQRGKKVVFRADPAFAKPQIYETLEERGVKYAIRLPANDSVLRDIEELLTRPIARPSHKPVVCHTWLLLAEGHLNRRRFAAPLGRIALLPVPAG